MSDKQKTAFLVAAAMAILHNGKRYEQNDVIELTEKKPISSRFTLRWLKLTASNAHKLNKPQAMN